MLIKIKSRSKVNKLHIKYESRLWRNGAWIASITIRIIRRTRENRFLSLLQLSYTFVPALDDLADTDSEVKRLVSVNA